MTSKTKQKNIFAYAVSMIMKAALLAALPGRRVSFTQLGNTWAGKSRKCGMESISKRPIDEKDREILFLRDRIYQLETKATGYKIRKVT